MTLSLKNSNKDFYFVCWVIKTPWLIYFRSFTMWKKHTDVSSALALVKIAIASQHKRQRKKSLSRFVYNWKHWLGPWIIKSCWRDRRNLVEICDVTKMIWSVGHYSSRDPSAKAIVRKFSLLLYKSRCRHMHWTSACCLRAVNRT